MKKLTITGQRIFWDSCAPIYQSADMTVDNEGEMKFVLELCRQIQCKDLITLGGAVGCRDPKMILEEIEKQGRLLPKVFFNDLSTIQVDWAKTNILNTFSEVEYIPGEIKEVCRKIPSCPRRLVIGIYKLSSFFTADPANGYPECGFNEYLKNSDILGTNFTFNWMDIDMYNHQTHIGQQVSILDSTTQQLEVKECLQNSDFDSLVALQVVGTHNEREGFFLSHWYVPSAFYNILEQVFQPELFSIKQYDCAKGVVFCIDPVIESPTGVVTVLNNVIGNILPEQQKETLLEIKKLLI